MHMPEVFTQTVRKRASATAIALLAASVCFIGAGSGHADAPPKPQGEGNYHKGSISLPLHRGAAVPFELTVIATPENCANEVKADISWDEEDNEVTVHLKGHHVLTPHPTIHRQAGTEWNLDPFWPDAKDVDDGRYQFWIVAGGGPHLNFYYDPHTFDLLGSELDFASPPSPVAVAFPTLFMVGSPMFQPDAEGNLDVEWKFAYDHVTRGDRPEYAQHYITFPPYNLCKANPYRFDLTSVHSYISKPRPAAEAKTWGDFVRNGLLFDVTVEPKNYISEPPLTELMGSYSGATNIGGTVPKGWTMDLDAALGNQAPPIRQWDAAGTCTNWTKPQHNPNLNFCQ
jgi:hypothetical protein